MPRNQKFSTGQVLINNTPRVELFPWTGAMKISLKF